VGLTLLRGDKIPSDLVSLPEICFFASTQTDPFPAPKLTNPTVKPHFPVAKLGSVEVGSPIREVGELSTANRVTLPRLGPLT
jgi:hypothetical protein